MTMPWAPARAVIPRGEKWNTPVVLDGISGFKVWMGTAFETKPVKVWNGSRWVSKPLKDWTGGAWLARVVSGG